MCSIRFANVFYTVGLCSFVLVWVSVCLVWFSWIVFGFLGLVSVTLD
jgi:hypothetical protein